MGDIAQLVERCPCKADVSGSSPLISKKEIKIIKILDLTDCASQGGLLAKQCLAMLVQKRC